MQDNNPTERFAKHCENKHPKEHVIPVEFATCVLSNQTFGKRPPTITFNNRGNCRNENFSKSVSTSKHV